jgi:hypothetical protein
MAKPISNKELAELGKIGKIKYDPEDMQIARFGELIDKLNELISQTAARSQADLARSQVQLEILGAIQKSMNQQKKGVIRSQPIDLAPLRELIIELQQAKAPTAYKFEIHRGEGGYMAGVTATPIEATRH